MQRHNACAIAAAMLLSFGNFEFGVARIVAEIVARSDPDEQNDGWQRDQAGQLEEPYPADSL
jgi:hypothetical protein